MRIRRMAVGAAALWLVFVCTVASAQAQLQLKPNDRVVFYGDSITQQMLYTRYIQQYLLVRYPDMNLTFFNAGWGGDTAPGGLKRLDRDVLSLNPTVVTLFFGMNDGRYAPVNDDTLAAYRNGMDGIVQKLTEKNIRVVVFSPGCVDYDRNKSRADADYNKTLEALGGVAREVAEKYHCTFFDVFHPMLQLQDREKAKDAKFTMIPDSVHPSPAGHEAMAHLMLQGLGAEPMLALGEADLASGKTTGLKILSNSAEKVELQTTAASRMPYWFDPATAAIMQDSGYLDFVGQKLTIKGLAAGNYQVQDDRGRVIGQGTAAQLAEGLVVNGSQNEEAKKLHDWISRKESNYFIAWREVSLAGGMPQSIKAVYDGMMATDAALAQLVRDMAQPTPAGQRITILRSAAGPNLALHKPYECSDPNRYNWGIGGLTDGSWNADSGHCFATGDRAEFPKTVTVDLQETVRVDTVRIGVPPFGSTKTIVVSVSQDGQTFTDVGSHVFRQSAAEQYTCKFKPTPARYVRLTYPDHFDQQVNYPVNFAFTTELEVFAGQ